MNQVRKWALCLMATGLAGCAGVLQEEGVSTHPPANAQVIHPLPPPGSESGINNSLNWSWPLAGSHHVVFSPLGKGMDFTVQANEPVLAAASGIVTFVGDSVRNYGRLVVIKHDQDYLSAYGNNGTVLVKEGEVVKRGEQIATTAAPAYGKWHFEIRYQGKPIDPGQVLPKTRH